MRRNSPPRRVSSGPDLVLESRERALVQARRYLRTGSPSSVHRLRIALRRLRACLSLFNCSALEGLRRQTKPVLKHLGALRDLQLQGQWLDHQHVPRTASDARRLEREERLARLAAARLVRAWARSPTFEDGASSAVQLRRVLKARLKRARRKLNALDRRLKPIKAHRARLAVKKLRYAVEILAALFPDAAPWLPELIEVQRRLGRIHDLDLIIDLPRGLTKKARWRAERERRDWSRRALESVRRLREQL